MVKDGAFTENEKYTYLLIYIVFLCKCMCNV